MKIKRFSLFYLAGSESDLSKLSRAERVALFLTGPWMIVPWGALLGIPGWLPLPTEMYRNPESFLFFQGSSDWGGGATYAAEALLMLFFGFTAAWHLVLRLRAFARPAGFFVRLARSCAVLSPFIVLFAFGFVDEIYDDRDHCALWAAAAVVYAASVVWIALLEGARRIPGAVRLALAPLFAAAWFVLGADGQTPRAGQMLQASTLPLPAVRSARHAAMLAWNRRWPGWPDPVEVPETSVLWFWTDGYWEFGPGKAPLRSPSALALRRRDDLPWRHGRPAFVVPVAADGTGRPADGIFPYSVQAQDTTHAGYFLDTPDGPVRLVRHRLCPGPPYQNSIFDWVDAASATRSPAEKNSHAESAEGAKEPAP